MGLSIQALKIVSDDLSKPSRLGKTAASKNIGKTRTASLKKICGMTVSAKIGFFTKSRSAEGEVWPSIKIASCFYQLKWE